MLEFVGDGVADEGQVGLVGVQDVGRQRSGTLLPVQALLDIRFLADDPGLEDGEVRGRRTRELLGDVLREITGEAGRARPARPAGVRPRDRRVEQPHLREIPAEPFHLEQETCCQAVERAALDRDLDVGGLALPQVGNLGGAILAAGEQHPVVVGPAVIGAVVQVGVEAVLVDPEIQHPQPHLLRRAVTRRDARPPGGRPGLRLREGGDSGEPRGVVELESERCGEGGVVGGGDVVGRDAPAGQGCPEVEGRPVDGAAAAARPLDLSDLEAAPLGRLRDGLSLQDARIEGGGPVRERLSVDVECVVRRSGHGGPRARCQAEPARAGVRGRLGQQPAAGGGRTLVEQFAHRREGATLGVSLDDVLPHAVRGEEQHRVGSVVSGSGMGDRSRSGWRGCPRHRDGADGRHHQHGADGEGDKGTDGPIAHRASSADEPRTEHGACSTKHHRDPASTVECGARHSLSWRGASTRSTHLVGTSSSSLIAESG